MARYVFNAVYVKVLKETRSKKQAESRAFSAMNSTIKKNMEKFGVDHYGHEAFFNHLTDKFLGKLVG